MKKVSSIICAIILFLNALLHIALILGAPLGEFVLGGHYIIFPFRMRMVSAFFAILWAFIGLLYLKLAGICGSADFANPKKINSLVTTYISALSNCMKAKSEEESK